MIRHVQGFGYRLLADVMRHFVNKTAAIGVITGSAV